MSATVRRLRIGLGCFAAQCFFYVTFARLLPKGPWSEDPGFTAHQVVCIPLMAFLTFYGLMEWFSKHPDNHTPAERILGPHPLPDLSEAVLAMMVFWDIPTGLLTRSLRDKTMVFHHVAMFLTATIALGAWSEGHPLLGYYAAFYFGAIEVSSIPLIFVDLFHPKHPAWHDFYKNGPKWLKTFNEINRVVFAVLFILARSLAFPYVSFVYVLPDLWHMAEQPIEERIVAKFPLYAMGSFNLLFSCLQFYWGTLVFRQVLKALTNNNNYYNFYNNRKKKQP